MFETVRAANELNHYYTKVDTVLIVGLPECADVAVITEKCEAFGGVASVRRPEVSSFFFFRLPQLLYSLRLPPSFV